MKPVAAISGIVMIAAAACAPAQETPVAIPRCELPESPGIYIEGLSFWWPASPQVLAPDESVVEAVPEAYRLLMLERVEIEPVGQQDEKRACTREYHAVLHGYRVTKVVQGPFNAPSFELLQTSEDARFDLSMLAIPDGQDTALLVISPERSFEVVSSLPIMRARTAHQDHACFPTGDVSPAPWCSETYP